MSEAGGTRAAACWLMKAEPDSRIVKGKDVAFSVDHFEKLGTSQWDGVRNAQAKRYMKEEMKFGDRVLFYHSNTKIPGVAALAEISKEGYPDYTAWDPEHPYYDPKTKQDDPKWFMVDVTFKEKLAHFVPLNLYKLLSECREVPEELSYLTKDHLEAIKSMPLINRGRLSVQPVPDLAYEATVLLGEKGGFETLLAKPKARAPKKAATSKRKPAEDDEEANGESEEEIVKPSATKRTRKKE